MTNTETKASAPATNQQLKARKNSHWIVLSNGSRVKKDLVASVNYNSNTGRITLKGEGAEDFLCSVVHANEEDAQEELEAINEQLG